MERRNGKEIGDRIKRIRIKQGLTQDALAKKAEIPYTESSK